MFVYSENDIFVISYLTNSSDSTFKMKHLGNLKCFFNFEIVYKFANINICQQKYILDFFSRTRSCILILFIFFTVTSFAWSNLLGIYFYTYL